MNENGFKKVCKISNLREKEGQRFIIDDVEVALFMVNGKIHALSNICPHQHAALIYDGFIEDGCVVCPAHGWKFDLITGNQAGNRRGLDTYEVDIIDQDVYVKVKKKELKW